MTASSRVGPIVVRALVYATLFTAIVLVFVPARLLDAAGLHHPADPGALQIGGLALAVSGVSLAVWSVLAFALFGHGTPAPFDPPRHLVVTGPYRWVRNPMYVGAGVALVGTALWFGSGVLLAYVGLLFLVVERFVLGYEEPTLRRLFGADYDGYCAAVGRWWPGRPAPARPGDRRSAWLHLGDAIPAVFWLTLLACGRRYPGYDHRTGLVSELGALGAPTQHLFTAGLLLCAALSVGFLAALVRRCRQVGASTLPIWVLAAFTVSIAGAALFPLPMRLHLFLGSPALLLVLSPLLALALWRAGAPAGIRVHAVIAAVILALAFVVFVPEVAGTAPGLKQRLAHVGWSYWFVALGRRI
ncbi:MAG: DUF998 domain-containing protein [Candidatus Krumholzibacteriia bacterium]